MIINKTLILAGALVAFGAIAQPALAAGADPGQTFIDRLSGASVSTSHASQQVRPSDYYGLYNGASAESDPFVRTEGLSMGERAGAVRY